MRRNIGVFALVAGAVLVLVGSLLPVYRQSYRLAERLEFEVTAWKKACRVEASGISCAALTRPTATG